MRTITHSKSPMWVPRWGLVLVGVLSLGMASCQSSQEPTVCADPNLVPGWPRVEPRYVQVSYQQVCATIPKVPGAEYVSDDEICSNCHGTYAKAFADKNVHRNNGCESCHGPASKHVEARGKEKGLIFSFKNGNPAVLAEVCLQCHDDHACSAGAQWRTSKHAACGVTCVACHRAHYDVPPGTPATTEPGESTLNGAADRLHVASYTAEGGETGGSSEAGGSEAASSGAGGGEAASSETKGPAKKNLPSLRGTSNNLGAVSPGLCYRCHTDMEVFQRIAGPHQICGPNGFNCTTCHDPHGHIKEYTRRDLCLGCHTGAPTMAWHSSIHELYGVACTDCHNPHPNTCVPQLVDISHYQVRRPTRLPMSVWEPDTCLKCHPKIYGMTRLPSHHPILEGKMVCCDCHDPHGQREDGIKAETINLLCYKCHAEKQGPFAYEHPPVTENCAYCHEPHGTVADNLLKQPPTFLCLRCHTGHRSANPASGHPALPNVVNIDAIPGIRPVLYADCTECHTQVHGTDLPSPAEPNAGILAR